MKTKHTTVQRNQARDFDVAMMDCKSEFSDGILDDSILDELALSEVEDDD